MKQLLKNRIVQFALTLIAGVAIGALFYPTKNIEERVKKEYEQKIEKITAESKQLEESLEEQIDSLKEEKTTLRIETSTRINKLTFQVRELESKKKETFYKIIKPDGTIEEKRYSESEVNESSKVVTQVREEFDRKVTEISERWQRVHISRVKKLKEQFDKKESEYKQTIAKLESEKKVEINPKKYGVELGYTSRDTYYGHVNVDVFGPIFIGLHTESDFLGDHSVGGGIGIRF